MKFLKITTCVFIVLTLVGVGLYFILRAPGITESEAKAEATVEVDEIDLLIRDELGIDRGDISISGIDTSGCAFLSDTPSKIRGVASLRIDIDEADFVDLFEVIDDYFISEGYTRRDFSEPEFIEEISERIESSNGSALWIYYDNEDSGMGINIAFFQTEDPVSIFVRTACYRNLDFDG